MPSSNTPSLRLEQQATGENVNTWGLRLNDALARIDTAIAGLRTIPLTGAYALTTANGVDDEARNAIIKTTGTGSFTVTIPSVSKTYVIWNACTGSLTVTAGGGTTVEILPAEATYIMCDGANVKRLASQSMSGQRLTNVGSPTAPTDAATKKYVDDQAWNAQAGVFPGQSGNANGVLTTDGTSPTWASPITNPDYVSDQSTREAKLKAMAVAFAVVFGS